MIAEDWSGRSVIVLGLARSGVAVTKLLHQLGAKVTVNDRKPRSESPEAEELERMGISVVCGGHPENLIGEGVDLLVKNPGIPYWVPPVQQAIQQGIPVVTEVEVAYRTTASPMIGITGSNGKTTTTALVGRMLSAGGVRSRVAGNIGRALTELVREMDPNERLVAELSSFQLKGVETFRPRIGALLNVVPAHLDYHGTMEDYVRSKEKMFVNQTTDDIAVLNRDSTECRETARRLKGKVWWFSRREPVECGVFIRDGWVIHRTPEAVERKVIHSSEIRLPGVHVENALAAATIALAAGCRLEAVRQELRTFSGVEHRLEYVTDVNGVRYYNDSKATNAKATIAALESFEEPIVLIAGGLDRGTDFRELIPAFGQRLKGIVTYGQAATVLSARAEDAGISRRIRTEDVTEALHAASRMAEAGDIVLLSPACASWDRYTSFEERGSIFKQAVHSL
ncbi:UDP-N-acetylmuramoyl-L-alanine--D-glutamate ligase [Paludifilum halophilum]|uniref:UDP-N-acetylmuramoylalanine--D-glutamate ligase n=1 Tax=Paludifilum halophilum TaxID=1642702 RepID=A0A235B3T1_9BACL|nr:UDP-N-acetylmuramoyl-L-alanine--D-glutamate ligase [Paludifilum halophilum]OYD06619.1 UDP-N-acetylmuramoyl-L-alanine--D-glutamate ligase [Paludifilum halophilum]